MLYAVILFHMPMAGWLQTPHWLWPATRAIVHFVRDHQALGLFLVIFSEELGIPLPAPGDAAITYGGYLTTTGAIPYPLAYLAVVGGATTGSFCLYGLSRRYGHRFLVRFGPYLGLTPDRLAVIIGRHIPGMRIVLSAFAGAFGIRKRVFVACVVVSSMAWAAIFLELGRMLGRNSRYLFRIFPAHLLPLALLVVILAWALWLANEHRSRRREVRSSAARAEAQGSGGLPPKAEGRTAKM